jgi:methyl-accepting chemotaxis protein
MLSRKPDIAEALDKGDGAALETLMTREFKSIHEHDETVKTIEVTDTKGIVVMRGHNPGKKGDDKSKVGMIQKALAGEPTAGLTVSITTGEMAQDAVVPLRHAAPVVGTLKIGSYLREDTVAYIGKLTHKEVAFVVNDKVNASTLKDLKEFPIAAEAKARLEQGESVFDIRNIDGRAYNVGIAPLMGENGKFAAALVTLLSREELEQHVRDFIRYLSEAFAVLLGLTVPVVFLAANSIVRPIREMREKMHDIAEGGGDLTVRITVHSRDEIADIAQAFNLMMEHSIKIPRMPKSLTAWLARPPRRQLKEGRQ